MKQIEEQTYYEILEVPPGASSKEVERAYERAKETYDTDSVAVYSLFSEREIQEIQKTIEEAYRTLSNDTLRKKYDQSHGQAPEEAKPEEPLEMEDVLREEEAPLSFTDISIPEVQGPYRGKTLKALREKMGINLENISKETKINTKILEYIEEEVREKLPAEVYLKGFLKGYARVLRLDPQKVVEGYLRFLNEAKKK